MKISHRKFLRKAKHAAASLVLFHVVVSNVRFFSSLMPVTIVFATHVIHALCTYSLGAYSETLIFLYRLALGFHGLS